MRTVWILRHVVNYEGFSIVGCFASEALARKEVWRIVAFNHMENQSGRFGFNEDGTPYEGACTTFWDSADAHQWEWIENDQESSYVIDAWPILEEVNVE